MNEQPRVTFNSDRFYSLRMVEQLFPSLKMLSSRFLYGDQVREATPPSGNYTGMVVFTKNE